MPSIETAILVAGLLLLAGAIAGKLSDRLGVTNAEEQGTSP
jgi:hypothetical protein